MRAGGSTLALVNAGRCGSPSTIINCDILRLEADMRRSLRSFSSLLARAQGSCSTSTLQGTRRFDDYRPYPAQICARPFRVNRRQSRELDERIWAPSRRSPVDELPVSLAQPVWKLYPYGRESGK